MMNKQRVTTPVLGAGASEVKVRMHFRPGLFESMEFTVWRMVMEINPKTGHHHLVCYDKQGEEVFSHDGCTLGIQGVEFLDSQYRDDSGNLCAE